MRMFLRRDHYSELLRTAAGYQSHEITERILHGVAEIQKDVHAMRQEAHVSKYIPNCVRVREALALLSEPHIRLLGLDSCHDRVWKPIHQLDKRLGVIPCWGPCPQSPPLFANEYNLSTRFRILMDVATAFTVAHQVEWYHGRLTPDMIRIMELTAEQQTTSTKPTESLPSAIVLHFADLQNRIGCGACDSCFSREKEIKLTEHRESSNPNSMHFSFRHRPQSGLISIDPGAEDRYIFGNLVCWLYSGQCFDYNDPNCQHNCDLLQHVPWPLRMIVTDAPDLELPAIQLWLDQLDKKDIDPLCDQPLCAIPLRHSSNLSSSPSRVNTFNQADEAAKSKEEAIFECSIRSAAVAAKNGEQQAVLHLGLLLELQFRNLSQKFSVEAPIAIRALQDAYDYYAAAAELQNTSALLHMARLQYQASFDRKSTLPGLSQSQILSLLLEAAVQRNVGAYQALETVCEHGLRVAMENSSPDKNIKRLSPSSREDNSSVAESDMMNVTYQMGLRLRRGDNDIHVDDNLAVGCFFIARNLGHLGASLELGLFLVERAVTLEGVRQGIDMLQRLANWPLGGNTGSVESLEACFRLGRWCLYGLPHDFGRLVLKNEPMAIRYLKAAAEQNHKEAMVQYGMLLEKECNQNGYQETPVAHEWISKVGDCPSAYCMLATLEWLKAKRNWNLKARSTAGMSFDSATSSDNGANGGRKQEGNRKLQLFRKRRLKESDQRSQSSFSNGSLTDSSAQDDASRELSRQTACSLRIAEKIFHKSHQPNDLYPEKQHDPLPLYKNAEFYNDMKNIWKLCDPNVRVADLELKAKRLLRQAIGSTSPSTDGIAWKRNRRNWILEDQAIVRKAESLLKELNA
ncbi:hypothetical protein FGB62_213g02 [Gracilaria domingensis]|nr:hypothetical protein FGB62_213g02 [Gracilaria domingensis]